MIRELQAGGTHLVFQGMLELRPNIGPESVFVERVDTAQRPEGYRVVGFFSEDDVQAAAAAGFRIFNMHPRGPTPHPHTPPPRPPPPHNPHPTTHPPCMLSA